MRERMRLVAAMLAMAWVAAFCAEARAAALSAEMQKQLAAATYVYVSSQRKSGSFSPPAEIWFMVHDDAVWIGTPATSWRARRIKEGRKAAKVRIGSPTGPEFDATAEIVADPAVWKVMFAKYAEKYPDGWGTHEAKFREGAASGTRVLIRYTPK